jgi:hypothetical protein
MSSSSSTSSSSLLASAAAIKDSDPNGAESIYKQILQQDPGGQSTTDSKDEKLLSDKEAALFQLGKIYQAQQSVHFHFPFTPNPINHLNIYRRNTEALASLVISSKSLMASTTAKAKTAKLGRPLSYFIHSNSHCIT